MNSIRKSRRKFPIGSSVRVKGFPRSIRKVTRVSTERTGLDNTRKLSRPINNCRWWNIRDLEYSSPVDEKSVFERLKTGLKESIAHAKKEKQKALWLILVPAFSNAKVEFKVSYHEVWDNNVRKIATGLTILKPSKGEWISKEGVVFSEKMIPVQIYCSEKQIEQIADMTASYYKQKAIMFYMISNKVKIKNYK